MINTIRLDGKNSYFYDSVSNEVVNKYDPDNKNLKLVLVLRDDSKLYVENENITQIFGGQIIVQYNDDRFIIEDGYRDILIKSGYIVYKDYDKQYETNYDVAKEIQSSNIEKITDIFKSIEDHYKCEGYECELSFDEDNIASFRITDNKYNYKIVLNTVNQIVSKNIKRKDNSLSFYPFDKSMDKFCTIYISIFAEKLIDTNHNKYSIPDEIIKKLMISIGADFHYISLPIKNQILWHPDL